MADQGLLAQAKPAGTTNTVLYAAPIDASASAVLTVTNDGTGAAYDVAIKDFDQKLVVDGAANAYKLHKGDVVSGYRFNLGTSFALSAGLSAGSTLTSGDGEKTAKFESFYVPTFTEVDVKDVLIRQVTLESVTGTFAVGQTVVKGSGGNTATCTIYAVNTDGGNNIILVGPTVLAGSGAEIVAGDALTGSGGATGTISSGGVGTGVQEFVFSVDGGTTYDQYLGTAFTQFADRAYRFDVSDGSMSGRDFSLSLTINGEWGPDGTAGNSDDGSEYTTGKTTNGTAGSGGAYVQYDFSANTGLANNTNIYFYDGGTGTAGNSAYGGADRYISISTAYTYDGLYVYDKVGTWVSGSDSFTFSGSTYTVATQTAGPYGYVRSYSGNTLYVVKGTGSADFAGSDTFQDAPKLSTATRSTVTVSSVGVATTALEDNYLVKDVANGNNEIDKITSIVVGPGQRVVVESATQNNTFSLIGFEDASTAFPVRVFAPAAGDGGGGGAGGGE
tara:strand:+ start:1994 stop:3499 length:1506 start_codon:yes stop_codon:yes gene_type:complete